MGYVRRSEPTPAQAPAPVKPARVSSVRRRPRPRRIGRQFGWGLTTAVLIVVALAGAIIGLGAVLVVNTLNTSAFGVCVKVGLYGSAPLVALFAAIYAVTIRRGRPFAIGALIGALLLAPVGVIVAGYVGTLSEI